MSSLNLHQYGVTSHLPCRLNFIHGVLDKIRSALSAPSRRGFLSSASCRTFACHPHLRSRQGRVVTSKILAKECKRSSSTFSLLAPALVPARHISTRSPGLARPETLHDHLFRFIDGAASSPPWWLGSVDWSHTCRPRPIRVRSSITSACRSHPSQS